MNKDRIYELKNFVQEFNGQLENSHRRYEMVIKKLLKKK
jgi:hypothetical protein